MPAAASDQTYTHWLIKAEPDSRIEKGVDVKFSIDDFEKCKVSSWEGVRNHQAKKFLKEQMKLGHDCLFYASNTKVPGVTGIAKVVKEGYPDYNAWDPKHPYYDPRSKEENPTWYMVDVEFVSRLPHLVPLSLLQHLSTLSSPPPSLPYLSSTHLLSIASSALISRGRLSVQPASDEFYETCRLLGERGGFEELLEEIKEGKKKGKGKEVTGKGKEKEEKEEKEVDNQSKEEKREGGRKLTRTKRNVEVNEEDEKEEEEDEVKRSSKKSKRQNSSNTEGKRPTSAKRTKKKADNDEQLSSDEEVMPTKRSSTRNGK